MVGAITTLHDTEQVRQGTFYSATAPPVEEVGEEGKGTGKKGDGLRRVCRRRVAAGQRGDRSRVQAAGQKKRLCGPGMSWGFTMAGHILRLRAPAHSTGQRSHRPP